MTTEIAEDNSKNNLYNQDYFLWLKQTASLIAQGKLEELDTVNLLEEIEDMGRSEKRAIESNLVVLLAHLLKYKYQPYKISNSWRATIVEHRRKICKAFRDSPSLKQYFEEIFDECYQDAQELASAETGMPLDIFPQECPFSSSEILDKEWLPQD